MQVSLIRIKSNLRSLQWKLLICNYLQMHGNIYEENCILILPQRNSGKLSHTATGYDWSWKQLTGAVMLQCNSSEFTWVLTVFKSPVTWLFVQNITLTNNRNHQKVALMAFVVDISLQYTNFVYDKWTLSPRKNILSIINPWIELNKR